MSYSISDKNKNDLDKSLVEVRIFDNLIGLLSNNHHIFIVRKSERLASALYVITGFMPSDEPVRTRLRICALEIITHSASQSEFQGSGVDRFESRCAEIITILQTAHLSGLISEMNAKLVGEEYALLAAFVRANAGKISERGHALEKSSVSDPKTLSSPIGQRGKSLLKSTDTQKGTNFKVSKSPIKGRKDIILSIFDKKESISIKDALSLIPGMSEKTIQRDILSLVADGALIKTGSRRWTTYRKAVSIGTVDRKAAP
jgi:hypothetical protein